MSFASAFSILGWSLAILGAAMLGPAAVGFGMGEQASALIFLLSAGPTIFVGGGFGDCHQGAALPFSPA